MNFGRDVICDTTRIIARNIHSDKEYNDMHISTCKVDLHLKGLVVTLGIRHTGHNLRHTVAIVTITFGFIFQNVCIGNVKPSMLWVPDWLRELFDSTSVSKTLSHPIASYLDLDGL